MAARPCCAGAPPCCISAKLKFSRVRSVHLGRSRAAAAAWPLQGERRLPGLPAAPLLAWQAGPHGAELVKGAVPCTAGARTSAAGSCTRLLHRRCHAALLRQHTNV